mmetsp:Transcript_26556/g.62030  ORF Transcript_26556/g.62030 Transcript_26556/m.62030 type:complete len:519 (-) Transcript_26556:161-1717(-)
MGSILHRATVAARLLLVLSLLLGWAAAVRPRELDDDEMRMNTATAGAQPEKGDVGGAMLELNMSKTNTSADLELCQDHARELAGSTDRWHSIDKWRVLSFTVKVLVDASASRGTEGLVIQEFGEEFDTLMQKAKELRGFLYALSDRQRVVSLETAQEHVKVILQIYLAAKSSSLREGILAKAVGRVASLVPDVAAECNSKLYLMQLFSDYYAEDDPDALAAKAYSNSPNEFAQAVLRQAHRFQQGADWQQLVERCMPEESRIWPVTTGSKGWSKPKQVSASQLLEDAASVIEKLPDERSEFGYLPNLQRCKQVARTLAFSDFNSPAAWEAHLVSVENVLSEQRRSRAASSFLAALNEVSTLAVKLQSELSQLDRTSSHSMAAMKIKRILKLYLQIGGKKDDKAGQYTKALTKVTSLAQGFATMCYKSATYSAKFRGFYTWTSRQVPEDCCAAESPKALADAILQKVKAFRQKDWMELAEVCTRPEDRDYAGITNSVGRTAEALLSVPSAVRADSYKQP